LSGDYELPNGSVIKLFRGDLSRNYLTFSKFVAFIGRKNRENFSVIPSFAEDISDCQLSRKFHILITSRNTI
jgi:hypothetical protein